jgi:site-specific DNA-methyltransferase (adenine-specific)
MPPYIPKSKRTDWETPDWLFDQLDAEFNFTADMAADESNAKCRPFNSIESQPVKASAGDRLWLNPPYGRELDSWVERAYGWSLVCECVVCLLPARTDRKFFHNHVLPFAAEIRFVRGRLVFKGAKSGAGFPSMIVVFNKNKRRKSANVSTIPNK